MAWFKKDGPPSNIGANKEKISKKEMILKDLTDAKTKAKNIFGSTGSIDVFQEVPKESFVLGKIYTIIDSISQAVNSDVYQNINEYNQDEIASVAKILSEDLSSEDPIEATQVLMRNLANALMSPVVKNFISNESYTEFLTVANTLINQENREDIPQIEKDLTHLITNIETLAQANSNDKLLEKIRILLTTMLVRNKGNLKASDFSSSEQLKYVYSQLQKFIIELTTILDRGYSQTTSTDLKIIMEKYNTDAKSYGIYGLAGINHTNNYFEEKKQQNDLSTFDDIWETPSNKKDPEGDMWGEILD